MSKEERTHTDLISSTVAYHCQAKEGNHEKERQIMKDNALVKKLNKLRRI